MLTEDDDRPDGGNVEYLNEQEMWRKYDRDLFTVLRHSVIGEERRSIQVARAWIYSWSTFLFINMELLALRGGRTYKITRLQI